jgi:prephenate dehydrogenase
MKKWDTVAIVGVGLLGGSIGLALQQRGLVRRVVGIGRRETSLRKARQNGTLTEATMDLSSGVADAELVVVCTPVGDIVERVCQVAEHCPPSALITDVGSTKANIVRPLQERLASHVRYVGSHPMAGSEKTGPENATPDLFDQRVTVVTPGEPPGSDSEDQIEAFWRSLGSRVLRMSPEQHDQAVGMTSHVTHIVASSLAAATVSDELSLAASGWRDTTRIAAGDPHLWRQILLGNREQVLKSLDKFEKVLSQFHAALESGDEERIVQLLDAGKKSRDSVGS